MFRTLVLGIVMITTGSVALAQGPVACSAAIFDPSIKMEFAKKAEQLRYKLLEDFEIFLRVYYQLKKNSSDPKMFMNYSFNPDPNAQVGLSQYTRGQIANQKLDRMHDFNYLEFSLFREQMQEDPRLADNLFMKKFIEYGSGAANDIFQRLGSYASEEMQSADFKYYRRELLEFSVNMSGLSILSYPKVYNRVSVEYDYPLNHRLEQPEKELRFFDLVFNQMQGLAN